MDSFNDAYWEVQKVKAYYMIPFTFIMLDIAILFVACSLKCCDRDSLALVEIRSLVRSYLSNTN